MKILSTLFPLFTTLYTIPGRTKFSEVTFEDIYGGSQGAFLSRFSN